MKITRFPVVFSSIVSVFICTAFAVSPSPTPSVSSPSPSFSPSSSPSFPVGSGVEGKNLYHARSCFACHDHGPGPSLKDVTTRRTDDWLRRWLASPSAMIKTDPIAQALFKKYGFAMPDPNPKLTDKEKSNLIQYFHDGAKT